MPRPPRIQFPGAVFHIINRGNHQQPIFRDKQDFEKFLQILGELKVQRPFKLYAYALLSNHFHLLLEILDASVSEIMRMLQCRYAAWFNWKYKEAGHLFQGRFKAPLCADDDYFLRLVQYIHLNPVTAGLATDPLGWPYSGHREYLGQTGFGLIDQELVLGMFDGEATRARAAYREFIFDGIGKPAPTPPDASAKAGPVKLTIDLELSHRPMNELAAECVRATGFSLDKLKTGSFRGAVSAARRGLIKSAFQAGHSMTDIADFLNISVSAVSKIVLTS
jgi:putative transposase